MSESYQNNQPANGVITPARSAYNITPNDADFLSDVTRAVYVGGGGNLACVLVDSTSPVTFVSVPSGTLLPFRIKKVLATGTTATNIIGVF